jgi:hypothetical protein
MGFEIKIEGWDDLRGELEEVAVSLVSESFAELCKDIEQAARTNCNDATIVFYFEDTGIRTENLRPASIGCIIGAIRMHIPSMPEGFPELFEGIIDKLESKIREMEGAYRA